MFAIVRTGGKQYKVAPGDVFEVERLKVDTLSKVVLDEVLLVDDGNDCTVGNPTIEGAGVECTVVNAIRGPKIKVFKFKAKKRYRRMQGHRQELTVLRVDDVRAGGPPPAPKKATAASKTKAGAARKTKAAAKAESKSAAKAKAAPRSRSSSKSTAAARPASRRKSS